MEPLDNPVWHALGGPQTTFAVGEGLARRLRPDVDPIAALPDRATPEAWEALAQLVGADGPLVLIRRGIDIPPLWDVAFRGRGHQMVASARIERPSGVRFEELESADDEEMLALARRTEPGPFAIHTRELGSYIGVRSEGRLVAMAGQRLRLPGYVEVSAVCTDPDHRGRGLAAALTAEVSARIADEGATPFLHVRDDNEGARRIYEQLGFSTRCMVDFAAVRPS